MPESERPPSRDSTKSGSSSSSKKSAASASSKKSQISNTSGKSKASNQSGDSKESKDSYYSNSNLDPSHPGRVVNAASARRQVAEAPDKRPKVAPVGGGKRGKLSDYPETIANREKLPLQAKSPWKGYPIVTDKPNYDPNARNSEGAVRGIYNNSDRSKFDVAYHDPTKSEKFGENYSLGTYRPGTHRDDGPSGK